MILIQNRNVSTYLIVMNTRSGVLDMYDNLTNG
jgi:hypothetical protein